MPQEITVQAKGIFSNPNYLSVPEGALSVAQNVVISRPGVIEPRRGYTRFNSQSNNPSDVSSSLAEYQHCAFWQTEPSGVMTAIKGNPNNWQIAPLQWGWLDQTGAFQATDAIDARQTFFRTLAHDRNFYITSISGVMRQSNAMTGSGLAKAGVPPGYIFHVSGSAPGSGSAIAPDCQVAYRTVWWHQDEAGVLHEGPPSGRVTFINQGVQIGPGQMVVVSGSATFTPTGGHPFVSGQLVNLGESVLVEPNVPMGDYRVLSASSSVSFTINLGNGLTFNNGQVIRVGNSARFANVQVQVPRGIPTNGAAAKASGTVANWYFQVYRSPASVESDVEASDDVQLVWESSPIVSEVSCTLWRAAGTTAGGNVVYVTLSGGLSSSNPIQVGDYWELPETQFDGDTGTYFLSGAFKVISVGITGAGAPSASFAYREPSSFNWPLTGTTHLPVTMNPWSYTVLDTVNDGLAGAFLYTNPNQQGILQQNTQPPAANDIAYFKNSMFYADTTSRQRVEIQLNTVTASWVGGSPGPTSSNPDDGIFVGMTAYMHYDDGLNSYFWSYKPAIYGEGTGSTSDPMAGRYAVYPSQIYLDVSPAQAIEQTAQALVAAINNDYRQNFIRAYYASTSNDIPGKIVLETVNVTTLTGTNQFYASMGLKSGTQSCMVPSMVTSSVDIWPNGLFFSKELESEAVPTSNFFRIGENDKQILRIKTLQNALVVVKEDGIFRVVGDSASNFRVEVLDNTIRCLAPETVDSMNNKVYMYTQYGVVEATEQGVQVISAPIDNLMKGIIDYASGGLPTVAKYAFAVADAEDRKYKFWYPPNVNSGTFEQRCDDAYVYDFYTNSWTSWTFPARHAAVNLDEHRLYACDWTGFYRENKASNGGTNWLDYMDVFTTDGGLVSQSGTSSVFEITGSIPLYVDDALFIPNTSGTSPFSGSVYWISSSSYDSGVSPTTYFTTYSPITAASYPVAVGTGIPSIITWTPKVGGSPAGVNQYREVGFAFRNGFFYDNGLTVGFFGDYLANTVVGNSRGIVGVAGQTKYLLRQPNQDDQAFRVRVGVPRNQQRCTELQITANMETAGNHFQIQNMSVTLNPVSEKQGRK